MEAYLVSEKEHSTSLRQWMRLKYPKFSAKDIERLLNQNGCQVNGAYERFGSKKLQYGDEIKVASFCVKSPKDLAPKILYQDDELYIIDKPSGLSSTLKDLQPHFESRVFLVHRLDKGTSGVLILARSEGMQKQIENLFFKREIDKTYLAITHGRLSKEFGEINDPIALKKRFEGGVEYRTTRYGKKAETGYKRLGLAKAESFVLLKPKTGRTHQLRVHLSSIGHPIIGDALYTKEIQSKHVSPRLCLHAYKILFNHPTTGKRIAIIAKLPNSMELALTKLFKAHKICAY